MSDPTFIPDNPEPKAQRLSYLVKRLRETPPDAKFFVCELLPFFHETADAIEELHQHLQHLVNYCDSTGDESFGKSHAFRNAFKLLYGRFPDEVVGEPHSIYHQYYDLREIPTCCRKHQDAASPIVHTMTLCSICGNKRCPKASDCNLECTGSNEPGQPGSIYE